jgi:signal transduction histidine kinase
MFIKRQRAGNLTFTYQNHKWVQTPSPLDSVNWTRIAYNKKDLSFWVVVEKQLVRYNKDFKIISTYTPKEGLPDIDIFNIIPDSRGNIWFNTDRSIHQLNVQTGVVSALTEKDGFEPQGFTYGPPMVMATDGDLYLGGGIFGKGFVRIRPEKYTNTPSVIYVKSLEINRQSPQLPVGVNSLKEIFLEYFQNNISLETGVIDYYSKGKGHIRYKLQGVNDDWQYEPAGYTIRYDGLLPGTYTLFMQASNAANEFIGPIKSVAIGVSPPGWQRWWAYVIYTLAFGSLVWSFIYYRSRELRKQNVLLEEKVAQRTNDLNRSLQDLRQTQNQLIQSEKMASLGELTAGIAHEIQNPLNFVNNFSEVSNELLTEMKQAIDNGSYDDVKVLSDDVRQNLEKILHHGKRADGIVKGMLQHSRASSGVKEATDINALADEYLRLAFHGFRAKDKSFNVTTKTDFDERVGKVQVVPQDIGRVVLNLITNAFYTVSEKKKQSATEYEPTVTVTTKKQDGRVLISIKDNGNGIPEKVLDKIFQPFFTTKPTGQGTGLGLSLSYDIVKAHGGELKVETKEGEGSEFVISLQME